MVLRTFIFRMCFTLAGLCLVILIPGMGMSFAEQIRYSDISATTGLLFIVGMIVYILIHVSGKVPIVSHVFGHEVTHVIWSWMFGGKLKKFQVSSHGGNVMVTRVNFLVRLAPYFFPLYAVILTISYGIIVWWSGHNHWFGWYAFLLGFLLTFHVMMTMRSLHVRQTDFSSQGHLFSLAFIALMNMIVIMLFLTACIPDMSFSDFCVHSIKYTGTIWNFFYE